MTSNRSVRFWITAGLATLLAVLSLAPAWATGPTASSAVSAASRRASWTQRNPAASPSPRNSHAMVYDIARGRTVLFGGIPGAGPPFYDDTWEWKGKTWTNLSSSVRPTGRSAAAMAYDSASELTVLFGGSGEIGGVTARLADTWELDGATWTQRFPATSPPGLHSPVMAYDAARDLVILFGGAFVDATGTILTPQSDTWAWDGANWTQLSPATSPPARSHAAMVYDSVRQRVVLFGGRGSSGSPEPSECCPLGDTWEWDGTTWTQRSPALSPPARVRPALTYDSARQRIVMFGGGDNTSGYLGDTWEWDGTTWSQISTAKNPAARGYTSLTYDAARRTTVLFGGCCPLRGDTWEYVGAQ